VKWLRNAGIVLAGILVAIGFAMLGRPARRAKRAEARTEKLLSAGTEKALKKAVKESAKADKLKKDAREAALVVEAKLEKISAKDVDMGDLLSAWESERTRQANQG